MLRSPHRFASPLILAALAAACTDQPTEPRGALPPAFTISDGARGGSGGFYFLPPMVPAPSYSGAFDAAQSPVVVICELTGNVCGATVASFSASEVKVDLAEEAYKVSWKTKGAGLDPTKLYRIEVRVGTSVLGFADVMVLNSGNQIRTVDRNEFVATINGGALNIRFRIETAAPPPPPPPPGQWQTGDLVTYSQEDWGGDPATDAAAALLMANFGDVYPFSLVDIGIPGFGGFSLNFTSPQAILAFLPATGAPDRLNADLFDPTSSSAGVFGGYVLALQLDVDFADAGLLPNSSGLAFGDLRLCNMAAYPNAPTATALVNGIPVREFLVVVNEALGGGPTAASIDELAALTDEVSRAFRAGAPSQFAQDHIVNGACPQPWQTGDVVSYSQLSWGGDPGFSTAAALLVQHFTAVYGGDVEVGIEGLGGTSMIFTLVAAVLNYMPWTGAAAPLNLNVLNPTSTSSGIFGGEVLALQFNVDFADRGLTSGTANVTFGDLRLCHLPFGTAYNGMTSRELLLDMNVALGGGPVLHGYDVLAVLTDDVNSALEGGVPRAFAQAHIVNGPCP